MSIFDQGERWETRGGRTWLIRDMSTQHLENTLAFLDRRAPVLALNAYMAFPYPDPETTGEHAMDAVDAEMDAMVRDPAKWLRSTKVYRAMRAELDVRIRRAETERLAQWMVPGTPAPADPWGPIEAGAR